jgi:hypothetical protein
MTLDAEGFFSLVDRYMTPPMLRLGYSRISAEASMATPAVLLVREPRWRRLARVRHPWPATARPEVFSVGYEAMDELAARRIDPQHPDCADELWVEYFPGTGRLDLSPWQDVLVGHGDAGVDGSEIAESDADVTRRLQTCGHALQALVPRGNED